MPVDPPRPNSGRVTVAFLRRALASSTADAHPWIVNFHTGQKNAYKVAKRKAKEEIDNAVSALEKAKDDPDCDPKQLKELQAALEAHKDTAKAVKNVHASVLTYVGNASNPSAFVVTKGPWPIVRGNKPAQHSAKDGLHFGFVRVAHLHLFSASYIETVWFKYVNHNTTFLVDRHISNQAAGRTRVYFQQAIREIAVPVLQQNTGNYFHVHALAVMVADFFDDEDEDDEDTGSDGDNDEGHGGTKKEVIE